MTSQSSFLAVILPKIYQTKMRQALIATQRITGDDETFTDRNSFFVWWTRVVEIYTSNLLAMDCASRPCGSFPPLFNSHQSEIQDWLLQISAPAPPVFSQIIPMNDTPCLSPWNHQDSHVERICL